MTTLFDIEPIQPSQTCRTCEYRERWELNEKSLKIIQKCGKSGKRIKVYNPACLYYKEEKKRYTYPTTLDEIDQWLVDNFGIYPGACSSQENLRYTTARRVAEALWPKKEDKK